MGEWPELTMEVRRLFWSFPALGVALRLRGVRRRVCFAGWKCSFLRRIEGLASYYLALFQHALLQQALLQWALLHQALLHQALLQGAQVP